MHPNSWKWNHRLKILSNYHFPKYIEPCLVHTHILQTKSSKKILHIVDSIVRICPPTTKKWPILSWERLKQYVKHVNCCALKDMMIGMGIKSSIFLSLLFFLLFLLNWWTGIGYMKPGLVGIGIEWWRGGGPKIIGYAQISSTIF